MLIENHSVHKYLYFIYQYYSKVLPHTTRNGKLFILQHRQIILLHSKVLMVKRM